MKSKIKEVVEVKEWGEGSRQTFYHNLVMDNGDKINIGKKKKMNVDEELEYEMVGDPGAQEFTKAKTPQNDNFKPSPQTYTPDTKGVDVQMLIVRQSSLNRAMEYYSGVGSKMEEISPQDVMTLADEFTNWVFKA